MPGIDRIIVLGVFHVLTATSLIQADVEWRTHDGIYGVNGIEKTSPEATEVAHTAFHYDNSANGSGPQTASFQLDTEEDYGDVDQCRVDDDPWQDVEAGLNLESPDGTVWSVNKGGSVAPEYGLTTVFTPNDEVWYEAIDVSVAVVDNDPSGDGSADDSDDPHTFTPSLTTFKVGVRMQNHGDATFDYWEDDPNFPQDIEYTLEDDLSGDLEVSHSTSVLGASGPSSQESTKVENDDPKWTALAGSSGTNFLNTIRGNIDFNAAFVATGEMHCTLIAHVDQNDGGGDIVLNIAGQAASFSPVGGNYIKAALDLVTPLTNGDTSAGGGVAGRTVINGVGTGNLNSVAEDIQTKYVSGHSEFIEIDYIPYEFSPDLSNLSVSGDLSLKPDDEIESSYAIQGLVKLDDDNILASTSGEVEESEPGTLKSKTTRPTFSSD